jgi:hypothetical protein
MNNRAYHVGYTEGHARRASTAVLVVMLGSLHNQRAALDPASDPRTCGIIDALIERLQRSLHRARRADEKAAAAEGAV